MAQLKFDNRVVLVTGGGRGMGRVHAETFAARGAKVIVSDVGTSLRGAGTDAGVADEVVAAIKKAGGEAKAYSADLSTEAGARGAVKTAMEAYGRIDVIVHNAGISPGGMPFERETVARLEQLYDINTRAGYAMLVEAWPIMQKQKFGRVVMVGSTAMYGIALNLPYCTAKASYIGLTRSLGDEGKAHNIKVNLVGPSGVSRMAEAMPDSEFRRWFMDTMKPELVTAAVLYLGHEECAVTGEMFAVAGGRVARIMMAETEGFIKRDLTAEDVRDHLGDIMGAAKLTTYGTYDDSAITLMNALGFKPTEPMGQVSSAPPPA